MHDAKKMILLFYYRAPYFAFIDEDSKGINGNKNLVNPLNILVVY